MKNQKEETPKIEVLIEGTILYFLQRNFSPQKFLSAILKVLKVLIGLRK